MERYNNFVTNVREWLQARLINCNVELNTFNTHFEGGLTDVVGVFNTLGGTIDGQEVEVTPFLMTFWFDERNEDVIIALNDFVREYNAKSMQLDTDNFKVYATMPIQQAPHSEDSTGFKTSVVITGTLVITRNLTDISGILINNVPIKYINARITYTTSPASSKVNNNTLIRNKVQTSGLSLELTCNHHISNLSTILRGLRMGTRKPNTAIKIKLKWSDGIDEKYTTYIDSYSLTTDRQNPALTTIVFGLYYE